MDQRRAAGALLALAVCITSTAAAPTVSNQTGLDLYDGSPEGCYYNFQHYGEGDRIMTNEPCLNCTCHNRMLMCYLRVCPFTKPIGQDCTVEKRADQCCPIVTCPDVPVDLLTSTSTTSPAEYGATGVGKLDKYGCSINGKYFPEGSKVPPTPNKPCEHCYCIRNMTTCVMQECTLHVDGCTPIYHKDVCCPVRYSCDHPEDSTLLLDDMTTTVRPTPGFLLTTTTLSPVTQMSQDCVHDDRIFPDGALIKTEKACEHCYCMKGDIVCVVQECGTPMENEGKNCTSQPPREGQCCPDTYICEGDEMTTEPPSEFSTQSVLEELTTLTPPRRVGVEGSGYRNEPDEPAYTEVPSMETEAEGSGYEQSTVPAADDESKVLTSETPDISSGPLDESLYPRRTTLRTPTLEEVEKTTEPDKGLNTVPSDAGDEEMYKPSMTEKTPFEEPEVTESTLITEKPGDVEDKTTSPEDVFMPAVTIKSDESSSTTESAFRKEDTLGEPTEIYDLAEPEKLTTQATDIERETEEDVTSAKTKAPFMEELEKQTTSSPEITEKEIEMGIPSKESTTESVLEVTTSSDVKSTDKLVTDSVELGQTETTRPTVQEVEVPETTSSDQNEVEDISTTLPPARIPGEGDCLLNDITYRNNSNVPSTNNCHTSCRCVSSIIKCDPIICSPPPEYMDNCQPTYDSPDACCPTYVCHTGETMPPQPHSQMSGTDSPLPSSPIECHGDECEVKKDDNVPIVGDCGSAGCSDAQSGIPETPSEDCQDGKCALPAQPCIGGNCQETPQTVHCENGKCGTGPETEADKDIPICDNESDCKGAVPEVPSCDGEGCVNVNVGCTGTDCKTDIIQPETLPTHCENGKCGTEPEIVPVKNIPLCENESGCKGTIPDIPSCEGEGCVSVNVDCSGTDCSTDITKQPAIPGKDEESCDGSSCIRKEIGQVDSSLPSDCSGSDCLQQVPPKEDEINKPSTLLPGTIEDIGKKSTQQIEPTTVKYEIQTESPESQTIAFEDTSEHKPTEIVEPALEEGSTRSPLPQTTEVSKPSEEKISETEPSSQFDLTTESKLDIEDTVTKSPHTVEEDLSTSEPQISVTDETRIGDTDAASTKEPQESATKIQEPVTESQDVSTKVDSEESLQTGTTQHTVHESTESTHGTELLDIHTAVPIEPSTSLPEVEGTKAPEKDQTESSIPQTPEQADVTKVAEELIPYTPEIEIASTKLPELDLRQDVTESPATVVMDVSSQDVTQSNDIVDKTTKVPEFINADEHKTTSEMLQHELTTEGAMMITGSLEPEVYASPTTSSEKEIEQAPFTNAPSEPHFDDITKITDSVTEKIPEASTVKVSEDTSGVTSGISEIYKTEDQEPVTEPVGEFITASQESSTKQPVLPGQEPVQTESPEFTTDETMGEPGVSISEEDNKPQTTSTTPVKDTNLPSDTEIIEEGTTQAPVSEEKTTNSEPVEKPEVDDESKKQPAETSDTTNVAQESSEKPATTSSYPDDEHAEEPATKVTIPDKIVTDSSDTSVTKEPSKAPVDDYRTDEPITDSAQGITEQQEISTEEPSIPESPVTDTFPSEPYIPVHPETSPELATIEPNIINEIPDVEPETQTPEVESETKIPERSGSNVPSETEYPEIKVPESATEVSYSAATQQPEVYSETPAIEEIHTDEQPQSTEKPTKEAPEDLDTNKGTKAPEAFITEMPAVDEVPAKTQVPEVFVTEQPEKDSVTTESTKEQPAEGEQEKTGTSEPEKYSTVSVIQETTVSSVAQQESSEQPLEPEVTESDTPYVTSAPESHVKEPVKPVTETAETITTESHDMGVSVPQEKISPDEATTEKMHEGAPQGKPIEETSDEHREEKPEEKPHLPPDVYTQIPEEEIPTVLLEVATEPTQKVIPVKPQESDSEDSEKPDKEEPSVSQSPVDTSTLSSSIGLDSAVTELTQDKVTEAHEDKATTEISLDEQEKITTHGLEETMTTVQSSTSLPQDISSTPYDKELPEKDTIAVSEESTPGVVTDRPEKEETGSTQVASTEKLPEQVTEEHKQSTEEPNLYEAQKPDITEQESITDFPVSQTEESTYDEHTTPDVVELEEHSHKPVEESSTVTPVENEIIPDLPAKHDEAQQKPEVTTEKQEAVTEPSDEMNPDISTAATMDLGEIPHKSTLPPPSEEDELHTDLPTTSQPGSQVGDQRIGENASEEQKPSQAEGEESPISETEIPVQTEKVPSEKVTESELSHETTMLEEISPVTTKTTKDKEEEESSTQKPEYGEPEETPLEEKPKEKPQDVTTEKPSEELTEKPLDASTEKPMEEPQEKPSEETEPSEKPVEESEPKPSEDVEEKPIETPLEEPLMTTEIPLDEDKLVKPLDQTEEKTTVTPEQTPLEAEAPTEVPQEKPLDGSEEKPTETPLEGSDKFPEEKPEEKPSAETDEKLAEKPEETPMGESEEKSTEKPVEIPSATESVIEPTAQPEEKPYEVPVEMPEDKPLKTSEEKPEEVPKEEPQEVPEENPELLAEKPQQVPEEKPEAPEEKPQIVPEDKLEVPEEKPQEVPEEKPQEIPEEKPIEVPEEKPQDVPEEKPEVPEENPQEVPEEKPEVPEEKPQEVPEEKPQEVPEEKPEVTEEKPQEVPEEKPEVPEEKPQEVPEEKPQDVPEEKPEVPEEKPQEVPEEKPQEVPQEKPEVPEEKLQEVPEEKPQDVPEEKPEVPEEKPQAVPEEKPQEVPQEKPEVPEEKPQEVPEEKPQEVPEEKPEVPEEKPQEVPEEKPQEIPEEKPETPKEKPMQVPEKKPEVPEEKPQEIPEEKPEMPEEKPQEVPEEKPQEVPEEKPVSTASPEVSKPGFGDMQPTDEVPDDDSQFPPSGGTSGYGTEPDYVEEDQAFGPGTCRYGGKVYVSAQQIPRDDPCDFCFCFRSDIICLQQSCPPPIHGCHEEPIQGFCCPRYECPVAMATTLNVTTTTTTTTTTLPPHFLPHAYKGAAQRRGCQIKGHTYKVGEVVRASSGPCLHCTCGGDGQMKCDPKACTPEPMLRQMIAAAVSAKRRR
ncbi:hypothetical protein ABMA27_014016 [Loxostege sticticalis]|uniref:VWFC domain-containing protein n=1 Tax=Loxostege sticticalis TaxID=481309 RepID=A0ABR3ICD6_LOXSC